MGRIKGWQKTANKQCTPGSAVLLNQLTYGAVVAASQPKLKPDKTPQLAEGR